MALTGLPLLVLTALLTAAILAVTVLVWNRGGPWRVLTRAAAILLSEALVAFSIGLVVNRALDLFPSWSALLNKVPPAAPTRVGVARLDGYIATEAARRKQSDLSFPWTPADLATWDLAAPPTVYVPPAYLRDLGLSFPVVVVAADVAARSPQGAWDNQAIDKLARDTAVTQDPAVVVFVRTRPQTASSVLATDLPEQLGRDLRVGSTGWALVGVGPDGPQALADVRASGYYRSAGVVVPGTGAPPAQTAADLRAMPYGYQTLVVAGAPGDLAGHGVLGHLTPLTAPPARPRSSPTFRRAGLATPQGAGATQVPSAAGLVWQRAAGSPELTGFQMPGPTAGAPDAVPAALDGVGAVPAVPEGVGAVPAATPGGTAAGVAAGPSAVAGPAGTAPSGRNLAPLITVQVVAQPAARLAAALRWAYRMLPPALSAPITVVSPVPVRRPAAPACTGAQPAPGCVPPAVGPVHPPTRTPTSGVRPTPKLSPTPVRTR